MNASRMLWIGLILLQVVAPAVTKAGTKPSRSRVAQTCLSPFEARIHFVGTVLFTRKAPLNSARIASASLQRQELVAILPLVTRNNVMIDHSQHVEDHTSVIAFKPGDVKSVSGWTVKVLNSELHYVELRGEQLTFVAVGTNPTPQWPIPGLGHVGGPQLRADYQPPYTSAAAVVTIPAGRVDACFGNPSSMQDQSQEFKRVDTMLKLVNQGEVTIKADVQKSITFCGSATVRIANMPLEWLQNQTAPPAGGLQHYTIYCDMTGVATCGSSVIEPDPAATIGSCKDPSFVLRPDGSRSNPKGVGDMARVVNAESSMTSDVFCSNSQWP